jgi:hypothetical protein
MAVNPTASGVVGLNTGSDRSQYNSLLDLLISYIGLTSGVKVDVIAWLRGLAARGAGAAQRPLDRLAATCDRSACT